jgi:hypothetical protein
VIELQRKYRKYIKDLSKISHSSESSYLTQNLLHLKQELSQKRAEVELVRLRTKRQKQFTMESEGENVGNELTLILNQTSSDDLHNYIECLRELKIKLNESDHNDELNSNLITIVNERNESLVIIIFYWV